MIQYQVLDYLEEGNISDDCVFRHSPKTHAGGAAVDALFILQSACFCTNTYTACIVYRLVKDPTGKRTF